MLLNALFDTLGWTEPWDESRVLPLVDPAGETTGQRPASRSS